MENILRWLPSVEETLQSDEVSALNHIAKSVVTDAARDVLNRWRLALRYQPDSALLSAVRAEGKESFRAAVFRETAQEAINAARVRLRPVVNGTGIILHTNLGRAPLSAAARQAVCDVASGYCNLEMDLDSGRRFSRYQSVEPLLMRLTGAEAALVVNNNAAAVLLALETLCRGREAVISRGQLVEIGGSFRVPEVMAKSGVLLKEVGTTNKTRLADYEAAIGENTGLLLSVHPSNFYMAGFVEQVSPLDLVPLGCRAGLPVMYDWGAGALYPVHELAGGKAQEDIRALLKGGVDIVTFSGDKLLGGPQAGIIVGKKEYVSRMAKNPLTRALRVDKMMLAAMEATLKSYIDMNVAVKQIPVLTLLNKKPAEILQEAEDLRARLAPVLADWRLTIREAGGQVGGGSLPDAQLPSFVLELAPPDGGEEKIAALLRRGEPSLVCYIREGSLCIDLRTLLPGDADRIVAAFSSL